MSCSYPAGTHTEWLVTGDPGPDFPPYRFVFTDPEKLSQFLDPDNAFLRNVANIAVTWRTVMVEEWQPATGPYLRRLGVTPPGDEPDRPDTHN